MTSYLYAGKGGSGKTSQALQTAKAIGSGLYAILEKKDEEIIIDALSETDVEVVNLSEINESTLMNDPVATLILFSQFVERVKNEKPKVVVVDGISEIRTFAIDKWILENPIKEKGKTVARTKIGKDHLSAWEEVNNITKALIIPLINYGIWLQYPVVLTSWMSKDYIDDSVVGWSPAIKDWIEYPIQVIFEFIKAPHAKLYTVETRKIPSIYTPIDIVLDTEDKFVNKLIEQRNLLLRW